MNVLCLNVCRQCVPNIMSLGICLRKIAHRHVAASAFAWYSIKIRVIFDVRFERRNVDKKQTYTWKLKHVNSIPESFEYFCHMSSKSILIVSSCTVPKLVRFLRHSVCLSQTRQDAVTRLVLWNKKAQLSLTNPRDAKACQKLLQFDVNNSG